MMTGIASQHFKFFILVGWKHPTSLKGSRKLQTFIIYPSK